MTTLSVPFNRPPALSGTLELVRTALESPRHAGDGPFTKRCQSLLEGLLGAARVLLTPSCTHALEMAGLILQVGPDDEIIIPAFTFVSTANAFALRGAKVVFADIRADTLNLDPTEVEALANARTRAIVPVHYAGVGCEMEAILKTAARHGSAVVEDNAHGLFGSYRGRPLGSFGALSALSFHETKNLSCGEGGALVINDPRFVERAEIIREKGTNRSRFFRGEVDKYTWVDLGSSYLLSDLLAAVLLPQLEQHQLIQSRRRAVWARYAAALHGWAEAQAIRLPTIPPECEHPAHLFFLLLPSLETRQAFIGHLKSRGVQAVFHYLPLHLSEFGSQRGGRVGQCPVAEEMSDRLVRLPLFFGLSDEQVERVIESTLEFRV